MDILNYTSPTASAVEISAEGVLCASGDTVVGDGGNAFDTEGE